MGGAWTLKSVGVFLKMTNFSQNLTRVSDSKELSGPSTTPPHCNHTCIIVGGTRWTPHLCKHSYPFPNWTRTSPTHLSNCSWLRRPSLYNNGLIFDDHSCTTKSPQLWRPLLYNKESTVTTTTWLGLPPVMTTYSIQQRPAKICKLRRSVKNVC